MEHRVVAKTTSQDGTSATLTVVVGREVAGDMADKLTTIVFTFATARDTNFFDVTNREYELVIRRR